MLLDSDLAPHDETLANLLADLARFGVSIASQDGKTSFRVPPDAALPPQILAEARERFEAATGRLRLPTNHNECLVPLTARQGDVNLVCVHPAHGTAYDYRFLAAAMPERYAVFGLQAVRQLLDSHLIKTPEDMTDRYVREILSNGLCEKPLVLYGASSGGMLMLDIARKLVEHRRPPFLAVAGDTRDAGEMSESTAKLVWTRLLWFGFIEAFGPPDAVAEILSPNHSFWSLADTEKLRYFMTRVQAMPSPACSLPLREDVLARYLTVYREYMHCYESWSPGSYPGRGLYLQAARSQPRRSTCFRSLFLGPLAVRVIAGDHVALLRKASAAAVASAIDAEVQAPTQLRAASRLS